MQKKRIILTSTLLLTIAGLAVGHVQAQNSEKQISDRRAAFEERRQERRAEMEARQEERWAEFNEENPELAAEMEALRAERQAEREQRQAEFAEQYPNIAAAMEDGRFPGLGFAGGERNRFDRAPGFERDRGFDRNRRGSDGGSRSNGFRGLRR